MDPIVGNARGHGAGGRKCNLEYGPSKILEPKEEKLTYIKTKEASRVQNVEGPLLYNKKKEQVWERWLLKNEWSK